jgi:branched-chain amino acid transport system ATP-binding protein
MQTLTVAHADVYYGEFQALNDISLEVQAGEIIAIIGANGAGKTTLLRAISGVLTPASGKIMHKGESIVGKSAHALCKRGISMVPEGRAIFPSLSVEENLLIGGYSRRKGAWTKEAIYKLFPILKERASYPGTSLSGGEQQMLAIGRALMNNPDIMLMDEISLGLAPLIVKELYRVVREVAASGVTVVIVEQDVSRTLQTAERVYCLLEGRVSLHGRPAELKHEDILKAYFGV